MIFILKIIGLVAILDTIIGNRLFPSEVKVLYDKEDEYYSVSKIHRILFLKVIMYFNSYEVRRVITAFSFLYSNAISIGRKENAINIAKEFSNKSTAEKKINDKVVWTSKEKTNDRDLLLKELFAETDMDKKVLILEKLKKL